jgi:hypothetical protein
MNFATDTHGHTQNLVEKNLTCLCTSVWVCG